MQMPLSKSTAHIAAAQLCGKALPQTGCTSANRHTARNALHITPFRPVPNRRLGLCTVASATAPATGAQLPDTQTNGRPMNIVFVSAEVGPWSKTGGLGDVTGGLPIALAERGHKVFTIAPRYDQYADAWDTSVRIDIDGEQVGFFHTEDAGVDRVWVDHESFLAKVWGKTGSKLYSKTSGADYADNLQRFRLFNVAALEALRALPFGPGEDCVIVCNDWHTALLPVLLKDVYQARGEYTKTKVALTIHNLSYQGRFWAKDWPQLKLPEVSLPKFAFSDGYPRVYVETEDAGSEAVAPPGSKFDKLNWLKAGILTSDKLLTVSPNYAFEMEMNPSKGVELDDIIRSVGGVEGIVNGMDTTEWCPTQDKYLDLKYDEETVAEGKAFAKETLQAELGLPVDPSAPLFGFIGRLEEQKGVDVLLEALPQILGGGSNAQVVVLGTGKKALEQQVAQMEAHFPSSAKGVVEFNGPLAHLITAGSDFMLVPSRFEPCGLIQMHAMQYGTIPVVASTGGLVDTVKDGVTGFHCGTLDPDELLASDVDALAGAVNRAASVYGSPQFEEMRAKCIGQELSWEVPATKWDQVLQDVQAGRKPQVVPKSGPTPVKNVDSPAEPRKSDILTGRAPPRGKKPTSIGQAVQQAASSGGGSGSSSSSSGIAAKPAAQSAPAASNAAPTQARGQTAGSASVPARQQASAPGAGNAGVRPAATPGVAAKAVRAASATAKPASASPASGATGKPTATSPASTGPSTAGAAQKPTAQQREPVASSTAAANGTATTPSKNGAAASSGAAKGVAASDAANSSAKTSAAHSKSL